MLTSGEDRLFKAFFKKTSKKLLRNLNIDWGDKYEGLTHKEIRTSVYEDITIISQIITFWLIMGGNTWVDKIIIALFSLLILLVTFIIPISKFIISDINYIFEHAFETNNK